MAIQIIDNDVSSTLGHYVMRKGARFAEIHHLQALEGDTPDNFVEVEEAPPFTEEEYKARVQQLIGLRYSTGDEIAIINNTGDGNPEHETERARYMAYREECKALAKEELSNGTVNL